MKKRKTYSAEVKARAVLKLLRSEKTAVEIAGELGCHPNILTKWKEQAEKELSSVFDNKNQKSEHEAKIAKLERIIGRLTVENDFLETVSGSLR